MPRLEPLSLSLTGTGVVLSTRIHRVRGGSAIAYRPGVSLAPPADAGEFARDQQRAIAALHATRNSALCDLSSAWWLTNGRVDLPHPVTLAIPPGGSDSAAGTRQLELDRDEVVLHAGLPCTSGPRTAADVLRLEHRRQAIAAVDAITNCCLATIVEIEQALLRRPRQRGLVQARKLLGEVEPNAQSRPESMLRLLMIDGGLPRPVAQMLLFGGDHDFLGRSDLGYPKLRLAIEYLGRIHALTLEADAERRNALVLGGVLTLEVTSQTMRSPGHFIERVLAAGRLQHDMMGFTGPFELQ